MILALLLAASGAAPAYGYTLAPRECAGLVVVDTVPSAGAVDVPTDVRLALVFAESGCDQNAWDAALSDETGADVLLERDPDALSHQRTWLYELFPDQPLQAGATYTVTMTAPNSETSEIGFTTGTGTVVGITGEPTVTAANPTWEQRNRQASGTLEVDLAIAPAEDPDGLSIVQVRDAATDRDLRSYRVSDTSPLEVSATWQWSTRPAEVCPQVRQIDGAGRATEWSEPACVSVSGCSAVGAGGLGLVGAVLAGLAAAGRRSTPRARTGGPA